MTDARNLSTRRAPTMVAANDAAATGSGLRPSGRTLILLAAGLIAGAVLCGTTMVGLGGPQSAARQLERTLVPARTSLDDTELAASDAQASFVTAATATDPTTRSVAITEAEADATARDQAWSRYRAHAVNGPGERTLQDAVTQSVHRSRALGALVIGGGPGPGQAALLSQESQESDHDIALLNRIESKCYAAVIPRRVHDAAAGIASTRRSVLLVYGALAAIFAVLGLVIIRSARRDERFMAQEAATVSAAAAQAEFEGALQRGLEMEPTEESTYGIVAQALEMAAPGVPTELLVADSSRAHFRQVLDTHPDAGASCGVGAPSDCAAAASGRTRVFGDNRNLDACPHLRGLDEHVWSVCVPVNVAGRTTGVLHAQDRFETGRPADLTGALELIGRKAGERVGVLRVLASSEAQAHVDALTGLANRRTLENEARDLVLREQPFVVAFADLDHFKQINDRHGHEMGDRALRLFARVLRDSVRPGDLVARHGGEEFVIVLPDCSMADALVVVDRIRAGLRAAIERATVPTFTVSIGLSAADLGATFAEAVGRADAAMLRAKGAGRDRVVVADGTPVVADAAEPAVIGASNGSADGGRQR